MIGSPTNVQHRGHVNTDFSWTGNPEEVFVLEERLGEGYDEHGQSIRTLQMDQYQLLTGFFRCCA